MRRAIYITNLIYSLFFYSVIPTNAQSSPNVGIGVGVAFPTGQALKSTYDLGYFFSLDSRVMHLTDDITISPSFIYQRFSNTITSDVHEILNSYHIGAQFDYNIPLKDDNSVLFYPMVGLFYERSTDDIEADKGGNYEIFDACGLNYTFGFGLTSRTIGIEVFYLLNNNKATPSTNVVDDLSAQGLLTKESTFSMSTLMLCVKYHFDLLGGYN